MNNITSPAYKAKAAAIAKAAEDYATAHAAIKVIRDKAIIAAHHPPQINGAWKTYMASRTKLKAINRKAQSKARKEYRAAIAAMQTPIPSSTVGQRLRRVTKEWAKDMLTLFTKF